MCVCEHLTICTRKFGHLKPLLLVLVWNINSSYLLWCQWFWIKKIWCGLRMAAKAVLQISLGERNSGKWLKKYNKTELKSRKLRAHLALLRGKDCSTSLQRWNSVNLTKVWECFILYSTFCSASNASLFGSFFSFSPDSCGHVLSRSTGLTFNLNVLKKGTYCNLWLRLFYYSVWFREVNGVLRQTSPRAHISWTGAFRCSSHANYLAVHAL